MVLLKEVDHFLAGKRLPESVSRRGPKRDEGDKAAGLSRGQLENFLIPGPPVVKNAACRAQRQAINAVLVHQLQQLIALLNRCLPVGPGAKIAGQVDDHRYFPLSSPNSLLIFSPSIRRLA